MATLIPKRKSETPKNIYFDTKFWSIKQFGKAFDEMVLR